MPRKTLPMFFDSLLLVTLAKSYYEVMIDDCAKTPNHELSVVFFEAFSGDSNV